jgi:ParB family transcriptional regulator, chromosome partitioning protein
LKKEPLGKGLSAILKDIEDRGSSKLVPIDQITPGTVQPRFAFREEGIAELAASIKEKGLLQPILLKRKEHGYEIIAGERRFRASLMAGLTEVHAIVKDVDEREALEIALIENLQREDLNAVEVASVYERFVEEFNYTHQDLAKKIGVDRSSVSNFIRLLKLPDWIKDLIVGGKLSQGHARVLLSLKTDQERKRFVDKVLKEGISVREMEREVKKKVAERSSPYADIEESLRDLLQTKVDVTARKNRGKVIIEFYSRDDLDRILDLIFQGGEQ